MSNQSTRYSYGQVSVLLTRLCTAERLKRLAECANLADASKVLQEIGIPYFTNLADAEQLLEAQTLQAIDLLASSAPEEVYLPFVAKYETLNAKLLVKAKVKGADCLSKCISCGVAPTRIYSAVQGENCEDVPDYLRDAINDTSNLSQPRAIDCAFDRAYYHYALNASHRQLKPYLQAEIDLANILTYFRVANAGLPQQELCMMLLEGGNIEADVFVNDYGNVQEFVKRFTHRTYEETRKFTYSAYAPYVLLCSAADADYSAIEGWRRRYLKALIERHANEDGSYAPVVNYFLSKCNEIADIRFILTCINARVDSKEIIRRLPNA